MSSGILLALTLSLSCASAAAQDSHTRCKSPIEYGNRNQIDPDPLPVRVISGKVLLQKGKRGEKLADVITISDAMVGLFTEEEHRLVASVEADRHGRFKLKSVPAGHYRLVVREPTGLLCVANVPLRVLPPRSAGKRRRDTLVIHMRVGGIDDCSYGDFK